MARSRALSCSCFEFLRCIYAHEFQKKRRLHSLGKTTRAHDAPRILYISRVRSVDTATSLSFLWLCGGCPEIVLLVELFHRLGTDHLLVVIKLQSLLVLHQCVGPRHDPCTRRGTGRCSALSCSDPCLRHRVPSSTRAMPSVCIQIRTVQQEQCCLDLSTGCVCRRFQLL